MQLLEGGNTTVQNTVNGKTYTGEKIDLHTINLNTFRSEFMGLFQTLNDLFYKEYKRKLWKPEDLRDAVVFNGSSSFVMNSQYSEDEILKHKPLVGDIDITIPAEELKPMFLLLRKYENKRFGRFTYKGTYRQNENAIGDQILTIFRLYLDENTAINCQIDFEGVDFKDGSPTEFARFGHSSSFEDAKENIKALHHKFLIQAVITSVSARPDVLIATPASTPDNIKQVAWNKLKPAKALKFSVTNGMRHCLAPMLDKNGKQVYFEGLAVYKEIPTKESKYEKDVLTIFNTAFKGKGNIKDFHSFVGICRLIKQYCPKEQQKEILEHYFTTMFGPTAQKNEPQIEADIALKRSGLNYISKFLNLRVPREEGRISAYIAKKS